MARLNDVAFDRDGNLTAMNPDAWQPIVKIDATAESHPKCECHDCVQARLWLARNGKAL